MPEVTTDASLIIAISWQALKRAESGDEETRICNCTVVIVFAAFFVEATLNHFIDKAREKEGITPPPNENDGLHPKLSWVYNSFLADSPITDTRLLATKLEEAFPGFGAIRGFRNGVSHGRIDRAAATLENADKLRAAAKAIVNRLLEIAKENGIEIERAVDYRMAITEP
jgi:hypothetical protein